MPYIKSEDRRVVDVYLTSLKETIDLATTEGKMNFIITSLLHRRIAKKGLCYATINAAIGILECAKLELYRQIAASYEEIKKAENGPVSALDAKPVWPASWSSEERPSDD